METEKMKTSKSDQSTTATDEARTRESECAESGMRDDELACISAGAPDPGQASDLSRFDPSPGDTVVGPFSIPNFNAVES